MQASAPLLQDKRPQAQKLRWNVPTGPQPSGRQDDRVIQDIETALRSTGRPHLWDVRVSACDGVVTLLGRVPSYYLKQVAQTEALTIAGVNELRNELEVVAWSGPNLPR